MSRLIRFRRWAAAGVLAGGTTVALALPAMAGAPSQINVDLDFVSNYDTFKAQIQGALTSGQIPNPTGERGDRDALPALINPNFDITDSNAIPLDGEALGGGSSLTGPCMGFAMSFDSEGNLLDEMVDFSDPSPPVDMRDGGQAMTAANPFQVDVDGFVLYGGIAGPAFGGPENHTWYIQTQGISFDSGGDDNPQRENANFGVVNLRDDLPAGAKVSATFQIKGEIVADDGFRCAGDGYFRTQGGTPVLGGVGLVVSGFAGFGLLFNARPAMTFQA